MRVVITGASGNVGSALVRALADDPRVTAIVGIARRPPGRNVAGVEWHARDVAHDDLTGPLRGADAVVHLAWAIQPSRDLRALWRTNVLGSARVFEAAARSGAGTLVYASSVGVYSPGPKRPVDESWPRMGIHTSFYSLHKAETERRLDLLERRARGLRVVRLRPALIFSRRAASGIRRLFAGPLLPSPLVRPGRLPFVPDLPGLEFQAVHSDDVAEAYRLALLGGARGAFNVAAEPTIDVERLVEVTGARPLRLSGGTVRRLAELTWRLRLQPTPPGWVDMGLRSPLMDCGRARRELGWSARRSSVEALADLLEGMADRAGAATPPLAPGTGGPARLGELAGGIGSREPSP